MSDESRAYPSPLYFEDRLRIEVEKARTTVQSLDDALEQLRVIWAVKQRDAVLSFIENLRPRHHVNLPEDVQPLVAEALTHLVDTSNGLKPKHRHSADLAVSRLLKFLAPRLQMEVIWPWMQDSRPTRVRTVIRTILVQEGANPYADYMVQQFRMSGWGLLSAIARTPEAAKQIEPHELTDIFDHYISSRSEYEEALKDSKTIIWEKDTYKYSKYDAMLAARILIIGGNTIPVELLRSVPEVFSWAIDQLADPEHEHLLVFLIVENHESQELLWSAIRTAQRLNMRTALERALGAAKALLDLQELEDDENLRPIVQQRLPNS